MCKVQAAIPRSGIHGPTVRCEWSEAEASSGAHGVEAGLLAVEFGPLWAEKRQGQISSAVDTRADDAFSAIVLFNPHSAPRRDVVEVALNIPETVAAF